MTSSSASTSPDSGLLLVFSEPGKDVTLDEFHDWYDNEHIPLRTTQYPDFRSAARYRVVSSVASASSRPFTQASWAAIYTIANLDTITNPAHPYASLRTNRSAREADVLNRVAILDRRIYRLTYDSDAEAELQAGRRGDTGTPVVEVQASTRAIRAEQAAPVVIATSVTPAEDNQAAYDEWYLGEHVEALSRVPGWRRTRRFELIDALVNGRDAEEQNGDGERVPRCLGLHEYDSAAFSSTPEFAAALNTPWRTRVMRENNAGIVQQERRIMELYRACEPSAASEQGF
ncbi:hypothetical protein V8E36_001789 [Tilletia maclaganii]